MPNERAILCGDVSDARLPFPDDKPVRLRVWAPRRNVTLSYEDIQRHMVSNVPTPFVDLLDVATCVYCADQAVTRGGDGVDNLGEDWRRTLFFRIPVRHPDLWSDPRLQDVLRSTLGFLTEDEYFFDFVKLENGPTFQQYLKFASEKSAAEKPEEVVLFSGGLDSLGGAIQEAVIDKRRTALVTHRSTPKLARRNRQLGELLARHAPDACPLRIPVRIHKKKLLSRESTQRSRSFLYAALGAAIAQMFGLSRIRLYENGIVSLNIPLSPQVIGARATRTTHPQVLNGFAQLLSLVANKRFVVENPFLWKTKTDVLGLIARANCSELVKFTNSCSHTWQFTKIHPHCGTCSQCIDRRFAALAAGVAAADPQEAYKVDLLVGEREEGEPRTMLAAYAETASEISKMSPTEFFARYGEVSRVLRHLEESADSIALKVFELHQRHAKQIMKVVDESIAKHATEIRLRTLPPSCLLRLVCDSAMVSVDGKVAAASAAVPTPAPVLLKDNVFHKKGQVWEVRFAGGREFILLPSKGAAYLNILLANPRKSFPVTEIVFSVVSDPSKFALGNAGELTDKEALTAYRARYEDLNRDLARAEREDDLARQGKLREEMDALAEEIRRERGAGGRLRKASDDRDRVRKSFRAAIRRVVEEISKHDKRLGEHLNWQRVTCGWHPCYDPGTDIEWET